MEDKAWFENANNEQRTKANQLFSIVQYKKWKEEGGGGPPARHLLRERRNVKTGVAKERMRMIMVNARET